MHIREVLLTHNWNGQQQQESMTLSKLSATTFVCIHIFIAKYIMHISVMVSDRIFMFKSKTIFIHPWKPIKEIFFTCIHAIQILMFLNTKFSSTFCSIDNRSIALIPSVYPYHFLHPLLILMCYDINQALKSLSTSTHDGCLNFRYILKYW